MLLRELRSGVALAFVRRVAGLGTGSLSAACLVLGARCGCYRAGCVALRCAVLGSARVPGAPVPGANGTAVCPRAGAWVCERDAGSRVFPAACQRAAASGVRSCQQLTGLPRSQIPRSDFRFGSFRSAGNIAEGFARAHHPEFAHLLGVARASDRPKRTTISATVTTWILDRKRTGSDRSSGRSGGQRNAQP